VTYSSANRFVLLKDTAEIARVERCRYSRYLNCY